MNLWRRTRLTYRYLGGRAVAWRVLTFPLRFTPLRHRLLLGRHVGADRTRALRWYRRRGRRVTVVIPSYRDADDVARTVASIQRTTDPKLVRIVVADDASGEDHLSSLRSIAGIEVLAGEENLGFAANVNRGLRAAGSRDDVVLLNSDMEATPGWLACLQYAVRSTDTVGIAGAKLLYPDGRIQFAGTVRNMGAPEWFDHRYRFQPADWGPANVPGPVLATTGACMYIRREVLDAVGEMDEGYPMAYEDVDYCLRAWRAGWRIVYFPAATLYHLESVTRGTEVTDRERASQRRFWERWGDFLDARPVRSETGALRVIYVTEGTGVGGGHRDVFEHLNRLSERGHDVALYTLDGPPDWFELRAPVRSFEDYDALVEALSREDAIKVATWWNTAVRVWEASVVRGIPVYLVQDIETSYYPEHPRARDHVLASYRPEFRYMTISGWNQERLGEMGLAAELIQPGVDLDTFHPLPEEARREDLIVALGRSNPLKNLPLTLDAWRSLSEPRPELCLFGIEPDLGREQGARYVLRPSDAEVNRLFNQATVFVQTSVHEGFCLPPLEAMAAGAAVVCTDAHGNRDFCLDGHNCLIPAADVRAVRDAIARVLGDPDLRERLAVAGIETAREYSWPQRIGTLEAFYERVAEPRRIAPSTDAVPELRRSAR
ncbi:MAG TPA: glycosyltransferase [Solirubrobacteraceae bacterium]|nr:glycosyltransferase [Solirubrobacteraceae bacterium]